MGFDTTVTVVDGVSSLVNSNVNPNVNLDVDLTDDSDSNLAPVE